MNVQFRRSGFHAGRPGYIFGEIVRAAVGLQWAIVLVLTGVAWWLAGAKSAISVLAGGGAVALPNTLLALSLWLRVCLAGSLSAATFLFGEVVKIALTMALLILAAIKLSSSLVWLALIIGVVGALKAQWLGLWITRKL